MIKFLAVLLTLCCTVAAMADNLIKNGSFVQLSTEGKPLLWYGKTGDKSGVVKNMPGISGNAYCLKNTDSALVQQIKVKGGELYRASYMLKTDFPKWLSAASFQILWLDGKGKPLFTDYKGKKVWNMRIKNIQGTRDWQKLEIPDCQAPSDAAGAEIRLLIAFDNKEATCYFTDITFSVSPKADPLANRIGIIPFHAGKIDMKDIWDEALWCDSARFADFITPKLNTRARNATVANAFFTNDAIYIRFRAETPQADRIKSDKRITELGLQESCEFFLLPSGAKEQLQLFVTAGGKTHAFLENWYDGNWPIKLKELPPEAVTTLFRYFPDRWEAALKVPFAILNIKRPDFGAEFSGNFCRGNFYNAVGGKELSAWSALREPHFQFPGDFGRLRFEKSSPLLQNAMLNAQGASFEINNPTDKAANVECALVIHGSNGGSSAEKINLTVPTRSRRTGTIKSIAKTGDMRYLELRCDAKIIAKHCNKPSEEYYNLGVFDPENVRTDTIYLANDTPFFAAFTMSHNEKGKTMHRLIDRSERAFDLFLETPDGVNFRSLMFDAGEWRTTKPVKPQIASFMEDGTKFNRFHFELPLMINWNENGYLLFYDCNLPEGKEFSGRYYIRENTTGKQTLPQEIKFKTIRVGSLKRPLKKFVNDTFYLNAMTLRELFPQNTVANYKKLGMNRLTVNIMPNRNKIPYSGNAPKSLEDNYDLVLGETSIPGNYLYLTSNSSSATPQAWSWTHNDKTARAIGSDGQDAPYNQFNYPSLCPNYRGKFFQAHATGLRDSFLFKRYNCTWLTLDLELWPKAAWEKLCFCDRCLNKFRQLRPEYADADIRKLFREGKHSKFNQAWKEFKERSHADFIRELTAPAQQEAQGKRSTSPRSNFVMGEWCRPQRHLIGIFNFFELGLYYTPEVVSKHLADEYSKWGDKEKFFYPTFTFGQTPGCPDFHMQEEQTADLVLEAAAYGAQGICWYYFHFLEPRRLKSMLNGLNTIAPFEDIAVDGSMDKKTPDTGKNLKVTSRSLGGEKLIAIRAYGAPSDVTSSVTIPDLKRNVAVYDCTTGVKIGDITPQKNTFKVTIPRNRCRLFYAGTTAEFAARMR